MKTNHILSSYIQLSKNLVNTVKGYQGFPSVFNLVFHSNSRLYETVGCTPIYQLFQKL